MYPAAGEDSWLALAVTYEVQRQAFTQLAPGAAWVNDARFATPHSRRAHSAALDLDLARWTATQPRDALVTRLRAAGIASSPVLSVEAQWCDPHYTAREIKHKVTIPIYGEEDLFRAPWRFSDFEPCIERCGPSLGQHNDYVFGELLGLEAAEIADLKASGVIA